MKCFSVHMTLGVIEGIKLSGPKQDHLLIGSTPWRTWKEYTCLRVKHPQKIERVETIHTAHVCKYSEPQSPTRFEGIPFPIRPSIYCIRANNGNDSADSALVMVGTLASKHDRFFCLDEKLQTIGHRNFKKNLAIEIGHGSYLHRMYRELVTQRLFVMRTGSTIAISPKDYVHDDPIFIQWDGSNLRLIRNMGIADLILTTPEP